MPETLTARRVVYEILNLGEANVTGNGSCGPYAVLGGVGLCEHVGDVGGGRTLSAPTCLDIGRDEALRNLLCRWVHSVAIEDGRCTHEVYWQLIASCEILFVACHYSSRTFPYPYACPREDGPLLNADLTTD